jgi:hypothetical protein
MRLPALYCSILLGLGACSDRTDDLADDGPPMESDGSGDQGTEDGSGDSELDMLCTVGCQRFITCAPDEFESFYGDAETCEQDCHDLYASPDECREVAEPYAECTANLPCEDWPDLLDNPATSPCAGPWEDVMSLCDVG